MNEGAMASEERMARAIAAAGWVAREDEGFTVYTAGVPGESFRVWEDPHAGTRCTCRSFAEAFSAGDDRECEHILAVALHLAPPEDELVTEGAAPVAALRRVV